MFEQQQQQESATIKMGIAIALIILAVPLGIWVLTTVNGIINGPESPAIIQKIIPDTGDVVSVNTPAGRVEMPRQIFIVTAYTVLFLFLLIPTKIATVLLTAGISLLKPDMSKQLQKYVEAQTKQPPVKQ
ncbi:MAG: hypothetical protein JW749_01810 [Sedimentisphaerales bacterium]|nr:hypothetical protein [Sedimentisphaerales bacterium]